jgi:hypothetical protein
MLKGRVVRRPAMAAALIVTTLAGAPAAEPPAPSAATGFRLHGSIEPIRSQLVTVPD